MAHAIKTTKQKRSHRLLPAVIAFTCIVATTSSCSRKDASGAASNRVPVAGKITASTRRPATADTDVAVRGAGLASGYVAVFDHADAKPADVSYRQTEPGRWEVKTGPAHILYAPKDTADGKYSVAATFEQVEAPMHPEAFGVFIGGSNLNQPSHKYTYFIVRGDGKYMVKVRDGGATRTITDWMTNAAVPKQDANGKALYGIKIDVNGRNAKVSVNGAPVTTLTAKDGPLDGITGVRINHNLHVIVTPVSVTR